ncbi:hypothetical protein GE061_002159 [Apolygus lucorum]|uniref:DNA primase large subunit C-terminal domain-containing protein n=1 Tax=Apolygus lucorum TaxID=248454 RepID=A0A8S9X5Q2_APOLU|nr:hypothetical protein GE061_002159 [Apolygus lucorum]
MSKSDPEVSHEATTLASQIRDFSFLVSLTAWYNILFQINLVSKFLQSPTFDLAETISLLEKCTVFFKTFRANGFAECLVSAKELAEQLGAEAEFVHHKRLRKIKKNFDYENSDDPPADPKKLFEVEFFNPLADLALNELDTRFEQLQHFSSIWGFLFDLEHLPEHCDLLEKCRSLENHLAHKAEKDIDGNDMCSELESLSKSVMETVIVMSCCKFSIGFKKKIIPIPEGKTVPLRRALKDETASKDNGLFDYPRHIKDCKLSRNHAEITCIDSKVYLKAINRNTFINSSRVPAGPDGSAVRTGDTIFLGGLSNKMYETVIILVTIFSSMDEDYKYFSQLENEYPFFCYFPAKPPMKSIKTEHLYSITMKRLEVLRHLSRFGEDELNSPETIQMVTDSLKTKEYVDLLREESFYSDYKNRYEFMSDDHISQFILMVAFCRRRGLTYWFINQETKLFILRWFKMFAQEQSDFLATYKMDYEEAEHSELASLSSLFGDTLLDSVKYYKVHFTDAPNLLKRRKFLIREGFCYVRIEDMYVPIVKHLKRVILETSKNYKTNLGRVWGDNRIKSIIFYVQRTISKSSNQYESKKGQVTEKNIHQLCDESFPLCMKILQLHLSRDHHLRNEGRYQYTLFLKGLGLSLTNSVAFWKAHFTKKIEESVFMKKYTYHIRHAYGTEGKMADYRPKSCSDILKGIPGPLEYHGCPFKVLDTIRMKEALHRSGIDRKDYAPIMDQVQNGLPQEACKTYFGLVHGENYPHSSIEHPNVYYDESRKIRLRQREKIKVKFDGSTKDVSSKSNSEMEICVSNCQSASW